jgi:hypothetical protein
MYPRIFIGGTGRSGTTILYQALGCHTSIHAFPREMRFIVDPDGIMDLVDALTVRYSPIQARETFFRFERLMKVFMTIPERNPYPGFNLPEWLGVDSYWEKLEQFCSELVLGSFEGMSWTVDPEKDGRLVLWAKKVQSMRQKLQGEPVVPFRLTYPREEMKVVKYFSDRQDLIGKSARFVDELFMNAAEKNGKSTWCEKTPQNIFHIDFLQEMFPDSVFIHIKRDPRGVVNSMTHQKWAPHKLENACIYLKDMYRRWFDLKETLIGLGDRYYEITLEELAESPEVIFGEIAALCGLENQYQDLPEILVEKVNYWEKIMDGKDIALVNEVLGTYIKDLGYDL